MEKRSWVFSCPECGRQLCVQLSLADADPFQDAPPPLPASGPPPSIPPAEATAPVDPAPPSGSPVPRELANLPLYSKDEKLCKRWSELFQSWKAAYPGVDIAAEVAKAHAWEVANPTRQKVQRARFLATWLGRAQDLVGRPDGNKFFPRYSSRTSPHNEHGKWEGHPGA